MDLQICKREKSGRDQIMETPKYSLEQDSKVHFLVLYVILVIYLVACLQVTDSVFYYQTLRCGLTKFTRMISQAHSIWSPSLASGMVHPAFHAFRLTSNAQKLEELRQAAPKKLFLHWWTSVQTEQHRLMDFQDLFTW